VDNELVREFCKLLSGNNARELSKILGVHHKTAHSLLRLGKANYALLEKIAEASGTSPTNFHINWRKRWYVHRENKAAAEKGFPVYKQSSHGLQHEDDCGTIKAS
jgi:hypothetical protein